MKYRIKLICNDEEYIGKPSESGVNNIDEIFNGIYKIFKEFECIKFDLSDGRWMIFGEKVIERSIFIVEELI